MIPQSVTHLLFGDAFNQLLLPGSIPKSVTHLYLGKSFNQIIVPGSLPDSLKCIEMDRKNGIFDQQLLSVTVSVDIPFSVLSGDIQSNQTSVTISSVPRSVTHLVLSHDYNKSLVPGSIPNSLTHLALGNKFAQPLSANVLPSSLKLLVVSKNTAVNLDDVNAKTVRSSADLDWWYC